MKRRFIVAITGPAGSGKTTVGTSLAKQLDKCVDIDADRVKHFIVSGFRYETTPNGKKNWLFDDWELVGDSLGLLASNFKEKGFNVIINGFLDEPAWEALEKHISFTHKILLLPNVATTISRDKERPGDKPMGSEAVRGHHDYFTRTERYKDFIKIDSTTHKVIDTVETILKLLT